MTQPGAVPDLPIADLYGRATRSFVDFARTLSADDWVTVCPCTPEWTARDVLSHVAGVPDDGLAGRIDGAATEPWTASQVERNADCTVDELLERWLGQYELFGAGIEAMGEMRPPFDCHTHEHDIRHALGRPGNRDSEIVRVGSAHMISWLDELPVSLHVEFHDGRTFRLGTGDASQHVDLSISAFEVFRSRLGRRTPEQVRAYDWRGHPGVIDAVVADWFVFGPSPLPIVE